jgi:hypothetical protein
MLVLKKNIKLRVCIDFRNLNLATLKHECSMRRVLMLIDLVVGNKILIFMDDYSSYNKIFIEKDNISKIAFRCNYSLEMYE